MRRPVLIGLPLVALLSVGWAAPAWATGAAPAPPELETLLRAGVTRNFEGRLDAADEVWVEARDHYPEHPAVPIFEVTTLYWRQTFDESDPEFDSAIASRANEAIALCEARIQLDPEDAEAHFYLGQGLMALARLEVVRDRFLQAGAKGEKARDYLERALALDPAWTDTKHPLGMYYFYASVLPSVMKWVNFLWFVPKGDGPLGLEYLEQAHAEGDLHRWDAAFILLNIHTYLAPDHERALELARELNQRFPDNSLIHFEILEVLAAMEDWPGVIAEAHRLEQQTGGNYHDTGRRQMARVWRAGAEIELGRPEHAWQILSVFGSEGPEKPSWASAWIHLNRAHALDTLGRRDDAVELYRHILALEPPRRSIRAAELAEEGLEQPYAARRLTASDGE